MARLLLGGCDGLLVALWYLPVVDWHHGCDVRGGGQEVIHAVGFQRDLPEDTDFFYLSGLRISSMSQIIGTGSVLRTAVIFFYISNEGGKPFRECGAFGPAHSGKIKAVLEQLHDRAEREEEDE